MVKQLGEMANRMCFSPCQPDYTNQGTICSFTHTYVQVHTCLVALELLNRLLLYRATVCPIGCHSLARCTEQLKAKERKDTAIGFLFDSGSPT